MNKYDFFKIYFRSFLYLGSTADRYLQILFALKGLLYVLLFSLFAYDTDFWK